MPFLLLALSLSLSHFSCATSFASFYARPLKTTSEKGRWGEWYKNIEEKRQKTFGIFFLFLLFSLLSLFLSLSLFSFFSFCALLGIYIFKWKVKLIINCEEKVAAYVFASYCQLYAFSWPVPPLSLYPALSSTPCPAASTTHIPDIPYMACA